MTHDNGNRLTRLAAELLEIAATVSRTDVPAEKSTPTDSASGRRSAMAVSPSRLQMANALYKARRRRANLFGDAALFGEPGWDLMLDLYIASLRGKAVSVTSACVAAAVPTSTALRWIAILERRSFIERRQDNADGRRTFLYLTDQGCAAMDDFFAQYEEGLGLTGMR